MTDLLVVYGTQDNKWEGALLWAKGEVMKVKVQKECCYRGPNHRATHVYSSDPQILKDYNAMDVEILDL